jgi:HEAT repeat protein
MNDETVAPHDAKAPRRVQLGLKNLLVLVAVCGLFAWAGWRIWANLDEDETARNFKETLQQLRSKDPSERWRAAANLQIVSNARDIDPAVASLIVALGDQDSQVKITAARALGALVLRLRIPSESDVTASSEVVRKHTEAATTALAEVLADPEADVRQAALVGLTLLTKQPNSTPRGGVAARAPTIQGAESARPSKPIWQPAPELSEGLETGEMKWTKATAQAFYGYLDMDAPPPIVTALKDPSNAVRLEAVRCLENYPLNLDAAIPTLISLLEREDPELHNACLYTLRAAWPTSVVLPSLTEALTSKNADVRAPAILLLGRIGPDASSTVPALLAVLKESPAPATSRPSSGPQQDPAIMAARALGQISSSDEVIASLSETLGSDLVTRHGGAAYGLAQIGEKARIAAPNLVAAYRKWFDSKGRSEVGRSMTAALGRIAPKTPVESDAVKLLGDTLDSKDESLVENAARALAKFGKEAAATIPKLRALKENGQSDASAAAAAALEAIEGKSEPKEQTGR